MLNINTLDQKLQNIKSKDKEIYDLIKLEENRQQNNIELIASENFVSESILEAAGSILTNKYAEGYPGRRYYGGCQFIDKIEQLAIDRAKKLFGAEYANVQPHSGSSANIAAFAAFLKPGDKILGMDLTHGGHLTHGSPVNFSGKLYDFIHYGVNKEGFIDYDEVERLALEHKPKLILAGASAYARTIDFKRFREIADKVDAILFADIAHIAGLVAAELHPSPIPYCDVVTTTTHKTLRGPRGALILGKKEHEKVLNSAIFPGNQGGPLEHIIAAKAIAFGEALKPEFREYQKQVVKNAKSLAKTLIDNGMKLISDGTDNHLVLVDVTSINLTGKEAEHMLDEVNITVNKNTIPGETLSPFVTSGIRVGTPAMTTRGFKEDDFAKVGELIADTLLNRKSLDEIKSSVKELTDKYPLIG